MPRRDDPYAEESRPRLSSLAQASRTNQLKQIRGTLVAVGIIIIIWHVLDLLSAPGAIRGPVGQGAMPPANAPGAPNPERLFYVIIFTIDGGAILIGLLFVLFGVLVHRYPVPITIAALVLYVLMTLVCLPLWIFAVGFQSVIAIFFRIAFIVGLANAVRTAFAYRREEQALAEIDDDLDVQTAAEDVPTRRRTAPPPLPAHPGDSGIQAEAPAPMPTALPVAEDQPILPGDEHIQATPHMVHRPAPVPAEPPAPTPEPAVERSTELFDREFTIDVGRPWLGFVFACLVIVGMAFASALAASSSPALPDAATVGLVLALGYALLLALAVVVFFTRPRTRLLRFTAEGLAMTRPDERLAYDEILEIHAPRQGRRGRGNFAINLLHATGYLTIPPSVEADSRDLLDFLETQPLGVREIPGVDPILRDFLKQQVAVHGPDDVYVYRARDKKARRSRGTGSGGWAAAAFMIGGLGLMVLGVLLRAEAAAGIGIAVTVLSGLIYLLVLAQMSGGQPPIKDWQKATLVVGPDGLALMQGTLTGELRWRELQGVKMGASGAGTATGAKANVRLAGIQLQVAGAAIVIADIYHWPLSHALEQIQRNWRSEE